MFRVAYIYDMYSDEAPASTGASLLVVSFGVLDLLLEDVPGDWSYVRQGKASPSYRKWWRSGAEGRCHIHLLTNLIAVR